LYTVQWCPWDKLINERFIPLVENRDRYLVLWGSRGSSKSDFTAKKLIYRCLTEDYFRYILIRKDYNSIKDSSYQTIKDIIYELELHELFEFKVQPLEIVCKNGNKFIARGCDDTNKLKSVKDPTGAWYEEDIINEEDFITITTSIRTTKTDYLQEIFTMNPQVDDAEYKNNWFWRRFFEKNDPYNNFRDVTYMKVEEEQIELSFTVHHSTYKDNRWCSKQFIAWLMSLKESNPYMYEIFNNGLWCNKITGGLFYKDYIPGRNSGKTKYYPALPLHISFDFNVNPHMTLGIWQVQGKKAELVDEICLKSPLNTTLDTCRSFKQRYGGHRSGLFVYGDPAGKHEDTRGEKGHNDFYIIQRELEPFRPQMRVASSAPSVAMRGSFINEVFRANFAGVEIIIGDNCSFTKRDLTGLKQASDGTKHKGKVKDKATGVTYEDYGHLTDSLEYFITECFSKEFHQFQHGSSVPKTTYGFREENPAHMY
jgi:phage terminase large subunit